MSIEYSNPQTQGSYRSGALTSFNEMHKQYLTQGVNILSESVQEILTNEISFSEMASELTENLQEADTDSFKQLLENTRSEMLSESMLSGANPITALSLPMLRIGWPKIAVREGLPTEPIRQPKFKVTTKRPYIKGTAGEKLYLPQALFGDNRFEHSLPKLETKPISATNGSIVNYDLLSPVGKSYKAGDEIDPKFLVIGAVVTIDNVDYPLPNLNVKLDTNTNTLSATLKVVKDDKSEVPFTLFGNVDRGNGIFNCTTLNATLKSVTIEGWVSSEANNASTQISIDITAEEFTVGTGQPIESPINIQQMADVLNMYNLDMTLSHIETMTTFLAHTTDIQGVKFIDDTFERLSAKITETFDCVAPANYALGDVDYRELLKARLDRLIVRLQTSVSFYNGHAVIFCHPLDGQIISNVKWAYVASGQAQDVSIDYRVGTYISGTTSYTVLQSPYFSQGKLRVVFIPADADQKTLSYFPYSFTTVRGSASPNNVNIPSIQMIKRHLFESFTPLVGVIELLNNGTK